MRFTPIRERQTDVLEARRSALEARVRRLREKFNATLRDIRADEREMGDINSELWVRRNSRAVSPTVRRKKSKA